MCVAHASAQSVVPAVSRAGQGVMASAAGANRKLLNLGRIFLVSIYCYLLPLLVGATALYSCNREQ